MPAGIQYTIGGCTFQLTGLPLERAVSLIPAFSPFRTDTDAADTFRIDYVSQKEVPQPLRQMYLFESEGVTSTFSTTASGYVLHMTHEHGEQLSLWCSSSRRVFCLQGDLLPMLLRFALWMAYGLGTVTHGRIAIHGSCIVNGGKAFLFLGESGTGKSTHTRLWREHIAGSHLLNDDSPILSAEPDGIWVYGSPWSGKTPCYRQERYLLGSCVRLSQAPSNHIERLSVLKAYAALHPSCPPQFSRDEVLYSGISDTLNAVLTHTPVFHLACLPDADAARLSHQTLCLQQTDEQSE